MRSLIVEDDFTSRMVLQEILKRYGTVVVAADGIIALEQIQAAYQSYKFFDLVCMDIMMPNMDGKSALKEIRKMEDRLKVPDVSKATVFMTTALKDERTRSESFLERCDAYIIKPVKPTEMEFKLRKFNLII